MPATLMEINRSTSVAVKILHPQFKANASILHQIKREAGLMIQLRSPFVVACYGLSDNGSMIVMERMTHGSLSHRIETTPHLLSSVEEKLQFGIDIIRGLEYLHQRGVIHADVKSPNVLLTDSGNGSLRAKLSDFGLSHVLWSGDETTSPLVGMSYRWAAPELLVPLTAHLSKAADMYAYGVILWELFALQKPLKDLSGFALVSVVLGGQRDPIPPDVAPDLRGIITQCWNVDRNRRPSATAVRLLLLEHCKQFVIGRNKANLGSVEAKQQDDSSILKARMYNSITL